MDPTEILYSLILCVVQAYKWLHYFGLKLMEGRVRSILFRKLKRIGIDVVVDKNLEKTKENSKKLTTKISNYNEPPKMTIHDERFFVRMANERSMGMGESYVEGWWDCDRLEDFWDKFMRNEMYNFARTSVDKFVHYLELGLFNLQTTKRAYTVAKEHYDLGNSLYESFLDPSMTYTCGYWKNAKDLAQAQQNKLELVAQKLKLKPGMRVLELGCGWGGLAHFLADKYKVTVVACNIAKEGAKTATERCKGLPVTVHCADYREMTGKFDRVVAIGMMEHVGPKNYQTFFEVANRCLDDGGIFLIHTIGVDEAAMMRDDPWLCTYIFPNGALPLATEITEVASKFFTIEDWQNFGHDYYTTLMAWNTNFVKNWSTIEHQFENPTKFFRMWTYYMLTMAGFFKSRKMQLWQVVLTKNGFPGRYDAPR